MSGPPCMRSQVLFHSSSLPDLTSVQIDWEESAITGRVTVRPHIDEELDNWKHIYNGIDDVLVRNPYCPFWDDFNINKSAQYRVAQQISELVPEDYATSLNVVYFPQLGILTLLGFYQASHPIRFFDMPSYAR